MTRIYQVFINSMLRSFYGDRGVDTSMNWIKEIESKCVGEHRFKFATCMFTGITLLWWSIQVKALGVDKPCTSPWEELKKQIIKEFAEQEFSHLSTNELGHAFYTILFE